MFTCLMLFHEVIVLCVTVLRSVCAGRQCEAAILRHGAALLKVKPTDTVELLKKLSCTVRGDGIRWVCDLVDSV